MGLSRGCTIGQREGMRQESGSGTSELQVKGKLEMKAAQHLDEDRVHPWIADCISRFQYIVLKSNQLH